jgi:hypothetical protein
LQAEQVWPHAVPQQTPSTQNPLEHWTAAVQVAPLVSFARQVVVSQKNPAWQSAGPAQVAPHAPSLQTLGAQPFVAPGWQIPSPSQVLAARSLASVQLPAAQTVPAEWRRQPPLPSQAPSRPQVSGGSALQSFAGSSPAAIGVQVPARPATLQAWQGISQVLLQQTPSLQIPDWQSVPARQLVPFDKSGASEDTSAGASMWASSPDSGPRSASSDSPSISDAASARSSGAGWSRPTSAGAKASSGFPN